jgi:hypothetical protein
MKRIERIRKSQFDSNEAMELMRDGWRLTSVEWEREVDAPGAVDSAPAAGQYEELPYGLRVAQDCHHVEQDPEEMEALHTLTELIVQDATLTRMADELNRRGYKPREGKKWTALMIYNLFPRLIEVTPRIFSEDQWKVRRPQVASMSWNS